MRATATCVFALLIGALPTGAQDIPIRKLGPAEAVATEKFSASSVVRPLSDGRAVVTQGRRVLLFSADLATFSVAVDSTAYTAGQFGPTFAPASIIQGLGDTTYTVDQGGSSLIVIEPSGKSTRIVAVPKAGDVGSLSSGFGYFRSFMDPKGRLVYRGFFRLPPPPPGTMRPPLDTFPIVRADFDRRTVDTLAVLRVPSAMRSSAQLDNGRMTMRMTFGAYPTVDVWTMLSDGTIAIVRGSDYHVDWIHPDGSRSTSPKIPFDWRRITDDDKVRITDSLQTMVNRNIAFNDSLNRARGTSNVVMPNYEVAPASMLPDYFPPLRDGAARADADGNLWILPTTSASAQGGLLYDVVNRKGEVFERVQLPAGCNAGGFAPGRVVYLLCVQPALPQQAPVATLERRRVITSGIGSHSGN